jgi:glucose-6-phosphate isomerase
MVGRSRQQMPNLEPKLAAQKEMPGNRPSNTIVVDKMSPYSLGALIALYEHKVFCQAMLWQINPFDQWGVELGKELGDNIFDAIKGDAIAGDAIELDGSTESLLRHYLALRAKR